LWEAGFLQDWKQLGVKNLHFRHGFVNNFFGVFCTTFSGVLKSARNSGFLDSHIEFCEKNCAHMSTLSKL
jgi:hypothetical protein